MLPTRFSSNLIELPTNASIRAEDVREIRYLKPNPDSVDKEGNASRHRVAIQTKYAHHTILFDDFESAAAWAAELHRAVYKFDKPTPDSLRDVLRFFSIEVLEEEIARRRAK